MMKNREGISRMGCRLIALAGLVVALGLGMLPTQAWAQITCPTASTGDFDGDGFTDSQECSGITTGGTSPKSFPWCGSAAGLSREECVDPNTKDLFVIYEPAPDSLLPADYKPFVPVTVYGVAFTGLNALSVTVHQITPAQAILGRTVTSVSPQKAVKVAESLDTGGTILGNCQWGTPNGLDGCVVFTQRARNLINSTCAGRTVFTPGGTTGSDINVDSVFKAYITYLFLHETGHSIGGLTAAYNSKFGGYHYQPGSLLLLEQAVTYSAKAGKCTFYISPVWNALDAAAVKLK